MNLLEEGYVVDVPYPTFVHRQAMPLWLTTVAQMQGDQAPNIQKKYRYLELGCAMGIHLHLTAAAHPQGHFVGVDFNPQQLMVAQEGLDTTKINNLEFIHASFTQLLKHDLEPFDFIVTHGVWSWIAEEHQQAIVSLVEKLLKPSGIFYCSYMSHPGATGLSSVQKLMFEMSRNLQGDSASKAMQSLGFIRQLAKTKVGLFEKIPSLERDLAELAQDKPNYVAHDFLSQHWQPQHSADMIRKLGKINLSYSCGAGIMENLDRLSLHPDIRTMIQNLPLVPMQETVKDMARNTLQRQDIYIYQRQKLTEQQQNTVYDELKFSLLPNAPVGKSLKNDPKVGMIQDVIQIFEHILSLLSKNDLSIHEIKSTLNLPISSQQCSEIMMVLVWAGYIHPTQTPNAQFSFVAQTNAWMQQQQLQWRVYEKCGTAIA